MKEKINIVEEINDIKELSKITAVILENSGMSQISSKDNIISCSVNIPNIGQQKHLFVLFTEYLGGNYDVDPIVSQIKTEQKNASYNSIVIVSSRNITQGLKNKISRALTPSPVMYWGREDLVSKINSEYADYWRHNDQELLVYEKDFNKQLEEDWGIKKIKQFRNAHTKLLQIFIEPRLLKKVVDKESPKKAFERVSVETLKDIDKPIALEGEPGAGKTRLLKQLGLNYLNDNTGNTGQRNLPVFINNIDLLETRNLVSDPVNIISAVLAKLSRFFTDATLESLAGRYNIICLIDSMDEFDDVNQNAICKDLKKLCDLGVKVIFGTRFQDYSTIHGINAIGSVEEIYVEKFSENQIRHFLERYFQADKSKAGSLIESLKENHIIQRLPITPLTLSLISILYEENNFEIPATITDVYDNFNNLLLGRSMPDSRFDFFDITIRERILSAYAYELLKRKERSYMTVEAFYEFFKEFFKSISGTINLELLPDALDFIIQNTGILILQEGTYVKFMHESYMEYYASREIFFYNREQGEQELVENFLDVSWQFTSIFYGGRVKQMPDFLNKIIEKTKTTRKVPDLYKSIGGLGYLIQALYLTDDNIRKDAVLSSLTHVLDVYEWMKKLSADEVFFFKNLSMPIAALINSMFFFEYHNSVTLRKPLELAYDEIRNELESNDKQGNKLLNPNVGFKLFILALTLASPRLNNLSKMEDLIYGTSLLNDPLFESLLEMGISVAGNKELYGLQNEIKRIASKSISAKSTGFGKAVTEQLFLTAPIGRYRYSDFDRIVPAREVRIITEGKTDAQIIEHAFAILTDSIPYWSIEPIHEERGGANELAKCLANSGKLIKEKDWKIIIGLFDNDAKGIQEFQGELRKEKFTFFNDSQRIKKHLDAEIYGVKLPVPPHLQNFIHEDQQFNFFSIEHYFPYQILVDNGMIQATPIDGVYKIKDSSTAKTAFSKTVRTIKDPDVFKEFYHLFKEIDMIAGVLDIQYKY